MKNLLRPFVGLTVFAGLAAAPAFADNLLINGSFETGDFTGFTTTNFGAAFIEPSGTEGYTSEQGTYFFLMGNIGSDGTISQTFSDVAGTTYNLSYYYASNGSGPADFSAAIDGIVFPGSVLIGAPNSNYVYNLYSFNFVGTGTDTVSFNGRNDPSYDALDNISVSTVGIARAPAVTPEPSSLILLGTGLFSAAGAARRKFRKV